MVGYAGKSKYRNIRTEYAGQKYDSRFEASVARDLDTCMRAGEIRAWDRQYKIECIPYDCHGNPVPGCKVSHRVDFRVHNLGGSFTLLEAKGFETNDWAMRRKWLERFWLPEHPDHDYRVVRAGKSSWRAFAGVNR